VQEILERETLRKGPDIPFSQRFEAIRPSLNEEFGDENTRDPVLDPPDWWWVERPTRRRQGGVYERGKL
jgi:hypothetical protein